MSASLLRPDVIASIDDLARALSGKAKSTLKDPRAWLREGKAA